MKKFCTSCGNVGNPVLVMKGSSGTTFLLCITFLLPGIIYAIWRSNSEHEACSACRSPLVIPVDSPMSKKLMGDDYTKMKDEEARAAKLLREAAAAELQRSRQEEAERRALPWIRRYPIVFFIPAILVFLVVIGWCVMHSVHEAVVTVQQTVRATDQSQAVSVAQKPIHHKRTRVKSEAEAASWHTPEYCEANGFVWHAYGCSTK